MTVEGDATGAAPRGGDADGPRSEKKAQSRRRILDAAKEVFFRDGFVAANLDEVAERAQVAKGTLYRYFTSKGDLYVTVLSDSGSQFTDKMREAAARGGSVTERVGAISRFYLQHWTTHRQYFQIFWAIDNQDLIGELPQTAVDEVRRLWAESLRILEEVLDEGVASGELSDCDAWEVANILWSLANSLIEADMRPLRRQLRDRPLEDTFVDAIGLIMKGLDPRLAGGARPGR